VPHRYLILDVFTDRPLTGNPLAVVLDAADLDAERMQAIAREFNLSETVFVRNADNPVHTAALAIFTPRRELQFAGHPIVGTAVALGRQIAAGDPNRHEQVAVLELPVGPVRCGVFLRGSDTGHAIFDAPQTPAAVDMPLDREVIAAALGIMPGEIGFENHRPSAFTAGLAFAFVPVRDLEAMARVKPVAAAWPAAFAETPVFAYCRQTEEHGNHFHARAFAPAHGIDEDPATGSAAAALAGVIQSFDQPPGGGHRYVIEQGHEIGRPSRIVLELDSENGSVAAVRIGGDAVVVGEGSLVV